jgi:hypothetical protein
MCIAITTSIYNTCNITLKHVKHLKQLLQHAVFTLLLPYDATQSGGTADSEICILATVIVAAAEEVTRVGGLPDLAHITAGDRR